MSDMTKQEFIELMAKLKAIYPNFRINEREVQAIWWEKFSGLRYDFASVAVRKYTDTEKYPPVPADILVRYGAIDELNRRHLIDLREVMGLIRQCFVSFDAEDEKAYMTAIRSTTFDECMKKARAIYRFVANNPSSEKFSELIGGRKW